MGLTRVYSTLAYIIAGGIAIALALLPKFGAVISARSRSASSAARSPSCSG